jgi:hypothetical protein
VFHRKPPGRRAKLADCAGKFDRVQQALTKQRLFSGEVDGNCPRKQGHEPVCRPPPVLHCRLGLLATHREAAADKRIALVIGNSTYQNVAKLPNPAKDADAVAQLFKAAGFDTVSLQKNVGNLDFKRAIRKFEEAAGDADIAVVYYAGRGIEIASLGAVRDLQKRVFPLECGSAFAPPAGRTKGPFHN